MADDAPPRWSRLASRYLYQSQWFNLRADRVRLPSGQQIDYTLIEHPGYVIIVPLLDDGRVVMERIYRYPTQSMHLECPAGGRDGEPPEVAARRELEEETGYRAERLVHLGRHAGSSGISSEYFDIYLATGLRADGVLRREATEDLSLELIPLSELHQQVLDNRISDGPSALAILLAQAWLQRNALPASE